MLQTMLSDRLMDICHRDALKIAERWYQTLITNEKTKSFRTLPKVAYINFASFFYSNLSRMFFADDAAKEVADVIDIAGYSDDVYTRGIPLAEAIYALVLLRRHIWLHAEEEAIFNSAGDMYMAVQSINRIILLFDYAIYTVTFKYEQLKNP